MSSDSPPASNGGRAGLIKGSSHLVAMSEHECWAHLATHKLGRLGLVVDGRPLVFPINYAAGDGAIVMRSDPGTKLRQGPGRPACFEIDGYEETSGVGWSVIAQGLLEDITDSDDARAKRLRALPVRPQAPGERSHWLALTPTEVSGRSFRVGWVPGHYLG